MKVVAFTGAGISKESGLDTFRKGGTWDNLNVRDVAYVDRWWTTDENRQRMLDFYNGRRQEVRRASPNAGHRALAELEAAGHEVIVITQNIDDLHERAGSTQVVHLHGEILKVRPENDESVILPWSEDLNLGDVHEGVQLRPHVVWFGEGLPEFERAHDLATAPDVDVLIVVGTTLEVGPANLCAFQTRAKTVFLVDPEPPEFIWIPQTEFGRFATREPHPDCRPVALPASEGVPKVVRELLDFRARG